MKNNNEKIKFTPIEKLFNKKELEKNDFANCNNKLSIQLARSLLFEEDPAQLRREP